VKVSVAVTAKEGLVVGMRSMPGIPYDGHTVDSQLEQVEILTDVRSKIALVDRGYHGVGGCLWNAAADQPHATASTVTEEAAQVAASHRARDRTHEDRRVARPQLAQGNPGLCDACAAVQRRAQPAHDLGAWSY
jgi:IS5 family transposase